MTLLSQSKIVDLLTRVAISSERIADSLENMQEGLSKATSNFELNDTEKEYILNTIIDSANSAIQDYALSISSEDGVKN